MRSLSCAVIALAMTCSCVAAYASGTILMTRQDNQIYNGVLMSVGSGLFTINDDGSGLKQLTPMQQNTWYVQSGVTTYGTPGQWLTRNFSSDGQSMLYFVGQADPSLGGPTSGKYYTMNLRSGASQALFDGSNDNAAPGYGYLAWGPNGSNIIAYTNSANDAATTPACVYVMQPDGGNKHQLWCAPAQISTPAGSAPTQAVEAIRWAGNGKILLAYVSYQPPVANPIGGYAAAYLVNVQTGTATEVASNMPKPPVGDVSYDGSTVLYQQYDSTQCGDENPETSGINLCVKNMRTGKITALLPAEAWNKWGQNGYWWTAYWYDALLLSPDGSHAAFLMKTSGTFEADLYVIGTNGTNLRQVTAQGPNPITYYKNWMPTAWSPDGTQILVNYTSQPVFGPAPQTDATWPSEVHIVDVNSGKDRLVTSNGFAVDWYPQ